ncbi:HPt (histidine-containing phosphotransfer) domain-containing protein [Bradyrhizobium sp. LM2.7]
MSRDAGACAMTPDLQRMEWMPSPPLAPVDSPLDLDHLSRMTLGDAELEQEVLAMFAEQTIRLVAAMAAMPAEAGALAHKLKGSARGIGAFAVADAAASLETAIRTGHSRPDAFAALKEAVAEVRAAIEAILKH